MQKSAGVAIGTACRGRPSGNMFVGEVPLLWKSVRITSTWTSRPTTYPQSGELQRQLSVRQGTKGAVPAAANPGGGLSREQAGVVRHARQRVAMDRHRGGLGPGVPGRLLAYHRPRPPGG